MGLISILSAVIENVVDTAVTRERAESALDDPRNEYMRQLERRVDELTVSNTNLMKRDRAQAEVIVSLTSDKSKLTTECDSLKASVRRLIAQAAASAPTVEEPPIPPAGIAPPKPRKPRAKKAPAK